MVAGGKYMSQKSNTFPCTWVKFMKPFPKQTAKLIKFFYSKNKMKFYYPFFSQMFHVFSVLLQGFFHRLQFVSNCWPKICWKSRFSPFFSIRPSKTLPQISQNWKPFPAPMQEIKTNIYPCLKHRQISDWIRKTETD